MDRRPRRPRARRRAARRNLWDLAVLGLLRERQMHPYEIQRQMHIRHTDVLLALKRGSLYHSINHLLKTGLIEPVETSREGRWPERTVYQLTPAGDDELVTWLRELLAMPVQEPSHFMAALAHVLQLTPADALQQLELRTVSLEASIAAMHAVEHRLTTLIGRFSILETEYARGLAEAELAYVRGLIDDLRSGVLTWDADEILNRVSIVEENQDHP